MSLEDVERELRERVGAEWRDEAEEGERLAAVSAARARNLNDVALHLAARGARVRVDVPGRSLIGLVWSAGEDVLTLDLDDARVHVRLGALSLITLHGPGSEPAKNPKSGSFRAALHELEGKGRAEIALDDGTVLNGAIRVVASDHLLFSDDHERVLPIERIAWVLMRFEDFSLGG